MAGPQYTVKDLVYYTGLFGGIIVGSLTIRSLGYHPILGLIVGLVIGVPLGWGLQVVYEKMTAPRDGEDRDRFPDDFD